MKEVLAAIKPSLKEQQAADAATRLFLKKLTPALHDANAILGGSGAKGTWLAGSHDVDIFVLFNYQKYKERSSALSELLYTSLKKSFPAQRIQRLHGSRDYFQINYKDLRFEIVPILKITKAEHAKNITDISPLHAVWVKKNVKDKDQVRLAKQFMKANGLYGAESHIRGFSGYVVEILIGKYGTFKKLLNASLGWKDQRVIDLSNFYPKKNALFELNKSKTTSPIIVIDPVDKTRNAAAALSKEKLRLFQKTAKQYLKAPSSSFFEKKTISLEALQKQKGNVVFIEVAPLPGKEDVVGVKLMKTFHFLEERLRKFTIRKSGWDWNKFYFILEKDTLSPYEIRQGPPLKLKEFVADFKAKNKDTFIRQGKIFANVQVSHPKLKDHVRSLMNETYVRERIQKITRIHIV